MHRLALLSFHGCPVARLGEKDTGGMNVYVLQLARELASLGYRVDVYTRRHDPRDPQVVELADGARVVHLDGGPYDNAKSTLYDHIPRFINDLYSYQRSEGLEYDLVHSHYWLSAKVGTVLSERWGVPHVTTLHTTAKTKLQARAGEEETDLRISVERSALRDADAIVVSTQHEREALARLYGAPLHKVHVVSAGVDTELFRPMPKSEARRLLDVAEANVVLYVGRIEPLKGLELLLSAAALLDDIADTRLIIVGGKPAEDTELQRLKALAETLGIGDSTTFTGAVGQEDLRKYYSASDVFVLPSYYESFGLAALEAMACGTPVVVSRVGGLSSFVEEGRTGYLIPWRCPEPFAERIRTLLANPDLREAMGLVAREKSLKMTWGGVAERIAELYCRLTDTFRQLAAGA
jgi:D-inositol-3-phosphate glycosyltransferase